MRPTALLAATLCASCGTVTERPDTGPAPVPTPAMRTVPAPTPVTQRPPATWKGEVIEWTELQPILCERAGAVALEEVMLDRQLARLLADRGLKLDEARIDRERTELLETLSPDAERAARLLTDLRAVQGLGEQRWQALLRRNASARLLVQEQVKVTPDSIDASLDAAYGAKRRCRVIALADLKACAEARRRIDGGEPFGEIAVALSTDPSAARGGMVNPVSRFDTSWPAAFRQAVWAATPGTVTAPVLVGDTYVIARVEEELPATPPKDAAAARAMAERDTRRAQERVQMETLVAGLRQAQRDATVLDERLKDAWSRVRSAAR